MTRALAALAVLISLTACSGGPAGDQPVNTQTTSKPVPTPSR